MHSASSSADHSGIFSIMVVASAYDQVHPVAVAVPAAAGSPSNFKEPVRGARDDVDFGRTAEINAPQLSAGAFWSLGGPNRSFLTGR